MSTLIKTYSDLAHRILHSDTDYHQVKQLITEVFTVKYTDFQQAIRLRLTVIDSIYSTNMNRRYYGIEGLTYRIFEEYKDDKTFSDEVIAFTNNQNNDIIQGLFNDNYGLTKRAELAGKAISLISKYMYYLTNYQFPIYDSIVEDIYPKIVRKFPELRLNTKLPKNPSGFVRTMSRMNEATGIDDFDKLDNLLWLSGKILRGNFSYILDNPTYFDIVSSIYIEPKLKSGQIDIVIRDYIFSNLKILSNIIGDDLCQMIGFAKELDASISVNTG